MRDQFARRYRRLAMGLVTQSARLLDRITGVAKLRRNASGNSPVRRILVVELWNIGDVVLTIPFLAQLRAIFPGAEVTLLGQEHAEILLRGTGLVDSFIRTNLTWRDADRSFRPRAYHWGELGRTLRELRRRNFDLAFQAKLHFREHVLLARSGARQTVGYSLGDGLPSALTDTIAPRRDEHRTDDWFALLAPFGGPVAVKYPPLQVTEAERRWADQYLADRNIAHNDLIVGVHPGASVADKRWPLENFAEILATLTSRAEVRPLVFVEPSGYGASLTGDGRVASARVSLRQLVALISRCRILLCNDSGPMHIAGALGVPTVAIFGSAVAKSFSPLGRGHEIVAPETAAVSREVEPMSLEDIPPSAVQQALERVLQAVTAATIAERNDIDCGLA